MKNLKKKYIDFLIPDKVPLIDYDDYQKHVLRYYFASKFIRGKNVLDVACGTGYGSYYLAKKCKRIIGGDKSTDALKYAKKFYKKSNLKFVHLDATKMPFKNSIFDVVISFETLEHIKNYKNFISECKRVLKKNGLFICSTPNKKFFSPFGCKLTPFHVKEFYFKELKDVIEKYFPDTKFYMQDMISYKSKLKADFLAIINKILSFFQINEFFLNLYKKKFAGLTTVNDRDLKKYVYITDKLIKKLNKKYLPLPYKEGKKIYPRMFITVSRKN